MPLLNASRRRLLRSGAAVIAASAALPMARAQAARGSSRNPVVAQIVDVSLQQQDVSKDFLIGSRAAWADLNSRAGARGRTVQHLVHRDRRQPGQPARGAGAGAGQPGLRRPVGHGGRHHGTAAVGPAAGGEPGDRPRRTLAAGRR
jgi:hypothetical protein